MNIPAAARPHLSPWTTHTVVLRDAKQEMPGVTTYELEFAEPQAARTYSALPGQFNMLYCPGYGEAAISLSRIPTEAGRLVHTVRATGDVTNALARIVTGETLGLRGPFGNGWPVENFQSDIILVGGGIGVAPLRPVVDAWIQAPLRRGTLTVLLGARSQNDLLFQQEYADWQAAGVDVQITVDRSTPGWNGNVGVVPTLLDRLMLRNAHQTRLFVCGPEIMMTFTARAALERGLPAEQIWFSMERHMNCAIGHCGRCQFGPHFLCTRGPAFRYTEVETLLTIPDL